MGRNSADGRHYGQVWDRVFLFIIRHSFSKVFNFLPLEPFRRKLVKVSNLSTRPLCLGKSTAISVGAKIDTMPSGKSVPRTNSL